MICYAHTLHDSPCVYIRTYMFWVCSFLLRMLLRCGHAKKEPDRALDDRRQRCTMPSCGLKLSPLRRGHGTTGVSGLASQLTANTPRNWHQFCPMPVGCVRAHPNHAVCKSVRVQSLRQGTPPRPRPSLAQARLRPEPVVAQSSRTGRSQGATPGAPSPNAEVREGRRVDLPPLAGYGRSATANALVG